MAFMVLMAVAIIIIIIIIICVYVFIYLFTNPTAYNPITRSPHREKAESVNAAEIC